MEERGNSDTEKARPGRVLIVDDESNIRQAFADLLSDEGYEVTTAHNGRAALDDLEAQPADLVLMDIRMPVLDGVTATRILKAGDATKHTPVIIMSAGSNLQMHQGELLQIADAVIEKPIDFDRLLATMQALLK